MTTDRTTLDRPAGAAPEGTTPPGPVEPTAADRRRLERLWLSITMLGLTFAVFGQAAGNAAADTKLDLVVDPLRFLSRSLRLWDPIGNAGQLQNQAYGYLFPIGPFYALLHAIDVQAWEIQRAFESAVVCLAFLGTYRLARRLVTDSFWPALGAGLAYALAPRVLSELTSISAELMPVAALPWVLVPLVDGAAGGSPRRAAARSGVALLFAGGVNAAATLAILPAPALWLLTRSRGPRRAALLRWWAVAVVLACAWWVIPLALLGRYSPPFLDWIESSSTTTLPTSLLAVLRGVDHWEGYLGPGVWPGGWILVAGRAAILATSLVAAVGLVGLARRRTREAVWLWSCLLLGLVLVTAGHAADVGPPGAGTVRALLDGPLAPFRNVHKFDPLVRLPLALGVGHALAAASRLRNRAVAARGVPVHLPVRAIAVGAVAVMGAVAIAPVWTNHLVSKQRVSPETGWWRAAGAWLGEHSGGARALVVPGSASPVYLWGGTVDDALQPVATTPWTVRGAVPLTQAGYIRLLDEIEAAFATGAAQPALAPLLARAGIGYVVLANDLETYSSLATPAVYVRATLENSPGFALRAQFGQAVGGSLSPAVSIDAGGTVSRPAVQIYGVDGWSGPAGLQPMSTAVRATGSADALPPLVERGLLPGQAVLFGADGAGLPVGTSVTTDGIRRREASFAGVLPPGPTMTVDEPYSADRPQHDYLPADPGPLSAFRYAGISGVSASSSGADRLAFVNRSPRNGPWSAVDADPRSSWQSTGASALGQWLEVRFPRPIRTSTVAVRFGPVDDGPSPLPTKVLVTTDAGYAPQAVVPATGEQTLRLPPGPTTRLRITVTALDGVTGDAGNRPSSVAIASLVVPGVSPVRTLDVPSAAGSDLFAFDVADGHRDRCLALSVGPVCDPVYAAAGQEDAGLDRSFTAPAGDYRLSATVRVGGGPRLAALLDAGTGMRATATSVESDDPRLRPGAAVDGDPTTVWQAAQGDVNPELTLRFATPRRLTGLRLTTPATAPVAQPLAVTVTARGAGRTERWSGTLPADGPITFGRPVTASRLTVRIDEAVARRSVASVGGARPRLLAAGIGEVWLLGVPVTTPPQTVHVPCGPDGPVLALDDRRIPLQVVADRADLLAGRPVTATPCTGPTVTLAAGAHRAALDASPTTQPVSLTLARDGAALARSADAGRLRVDSWGATARDVRVDTTAPALLVVHENANAGWRATLDGRSLRAVRVDGWQQAFVVPADAHGTVALRYAPQRGFAVGLGVGAVAALGLVLLAFGRRRTTPGAEPAPVTEGGAPVWALVAGGAAAVGLLAGWPGLAVAAAVGVAWVLVGDALSRWAPLVAGALVAVGGLAVARAETAQIFAEQNSGQVQIVCVAALAIGAISAWAGRRRSNRDE